MKKVEPAVQTLLFNTASTLPGNTTTSYIDLSQVASVVNRRFYRQGINWAVSGIKVLASGQSGITVYKLPETWACSNAWEKAFRSWQKQQDEALDEAGGQSMKARFNDFKIFADTDHVSAGFANNLRPKNIAAGVAVDYNLGNWEPSKIVLPNVNPDASGSEVEPAQRFLHMVGINVNGGSSRGIIEGYADSRSYPQSPDPVGPDIADVDNWMARMFDSGNDMEEVLENATLRNDTLPYDQNDYPNGQNNAPGLQLHDFDTITSTTIGGMTRIKGGMFPCGLIRIDHEVASTQIAHNLALIIDLVPGSHRGYLCEPMTEM
jgi:hypothetical protein